MSFRINTNVSSLEEQEYLRQTSDSQSKTTGRVSSGFRIFSSGDGAAGLSLANTFRGDQAVLSQGIRNANDGLSSLQTINGGITNISELLDRARKLAILSASGTYTGSRAELNGEFQSVIAEVDRQAQAIGLNTDGEFTKTLSVFLGGGRTSGSTSATQNFRISIGTNEAGSGLGSQGTVAQAAQVGAADISTQDAAQMAVETLGNAIASLGDVQAVVGRAQNQFTYAMNLAQSRLNNLAASESRIRHSELAEEAVALTNSQILLQAGISAMAQANSTPQQVLSLLQG